MADAAEVPRSRYELRTWVLESADQSVPVPHFGRLAVCERLRLKSVRWVVPDPAPASGGRLLSFGVGAFLGSYALTLADGSWLDLTGSVLLGDPGSTLQFVTGRSAWEWEGTQPVAIPPQLRIRTLLDNQLLAPEITPANPVLLTLEFEVR